MANHISAVKRYRQSLKRKARNAARRSVVLTSTRKLENAIKEKDQDSAKALLKQVISQIMHSRSKGVYQRNTASRKVARLSRSVHRAFAAKS